MWADIFYPAPNFHDVAFEGWMRISSYGPYSQMHFPGYNFLDFIQIYQRLVVKSPVDNRSALIHVLAWGKHAKGHSHHQYYSDVKMGTMASQMTSLTIVYPGADQRKQHSSASLAFVLGIHRSPVNSPHKWPVTRKMFPFDDVIMSVEQDSWHRMASLRHN